jgi:hypothetical protein
MRALDLLKRRRAPITLVAVLAFIVGLSRPAAADPRGTSLADKRAWAEADKRLSKKAKEFLVTCATKMKVSYDPVSYKGQALPLRTRNHCEEALLVMKATCGDAPGKEAVQKKIAVFTCRLSSKGTRARLTGKTLFIEIDPKKHAISGKKKGSYSWKSAIEELL